MAQTVIGVFKFKEDATSAIHDLKDLNYNPKDMSIIMKDVKEARAVSESTGARIADGAAKGAAAGGVIGGLAGLLVGIGAVTIPGIGAILIGGPLATALGLTGAAATTATGAAGGLLAGGLLGALVKLGIPREHAKAYEDQIRGGGILLAVPTHDKRVEEVIDILSAHNAFDLRQVTLPEYAGDTKRRDDHEYRNMSSTA